MLLAVSKTASPHLTGAVPLLTVLLPSCCCNLPYCRPSALPWHHPRWSVMYNEAEQLFAAERAAYQEEFEDTACTSCVST